MEMVLVDSREKKWDHIQKYFDNHNIPYKVQKLDVGDYALEGKGNLVIDRKHSLDEVAQNLCSKDDSRFWRELRRAYDSNVKLIFLVEYGKVHSISELARCGWKSKYSKVNGTILADRMFRTALAYGVEWRFCDRRATGREIWHLLHTER